MNVLASEKKSLINMAMATKVQSPCSKIPTHSEAPKANCPDDFALASRLERGLERFHHLLRLGSTVAIVGEDER